MNVFLLILSDLFFLSAGAGFAVIFLTFTDRGDAWIARQRDEYRVRIEAGGDRIVVSNTVSADEATWIANALKHAWKDKP